MTLENHNHSIAVMVSQQEPRPTYLGTQSPDRAVIAFQGASHPQHSDCSRLKNIFTDSLSSDSECKIAKGFKGSPTTSDSDCQLHLDSAPLIDNLPLALLQNTTADCTPECPNLTSAHSSRFSRADVCPVSSGPGHRTHPDFLLQVRNRAPAANNSYPAPGFRHADK